MATSRQVGSNRHSHLPIESTRRLVEARLGTTSYPDRHAIAVAECADELAGELSLATDVRRTVVEGALLHDVGKLLVDDSILEKPGPLTEAERKQINLHPIEGERIVRWSVDASVADVVRTHHERWDGAGYPHGLAADEIPVAARVVAVADAYLAMLEDRPYRAPRTQRAALKELQDGAGTQFDPTCVAALVSLVTPLARAG